jgi:hypothetical protein
LAEKFLAVNVHQVTWTVALAFGVFWEYANWLISRMQKQIAMMFANLLIFIFAPLRMLRFLRHEPICCLWLSPDSASNLH